MREILYRGKRIGNGEWLYGFYSNVKGENGRFHYIQDENSFIRVAPDTVGQYTGLTDKNSTKIFEGDILKVFYNGKSKIFGVVKFGESRFYIDDDYMRDDIKSKVPMSDMLSKYHIEVVGNIHEHLYLLEGGTSGKTV